ncbi:MAG TPA: type II secretion system protein GspM [Burkholderiales bacterium]|nr:type II secretion system protein GspM [Burkholderiales bacterium]
MNELKKRWQRLSERIDALSLRERAMIFIAATAAVISLMNFLLIDPLLAHHKMLSGQIVQTQRTNAVMQTQIQALLHLGNRDPDAALKTRLAQLRQQTMQNGKTLSDIQDHLVSPGQMPALLEDILRRNRNVRLIALKTLPEVVINPPTEDKTGDKKAAKGASAQKIARRNDISIYKHGVELILSGSYFDLVDYLGALERLPWRMFWGTAHLTVDDDHIITLTLRVYTLSQDQAWLST